MKPVTIYNDLYYIYLIFIINFIIIFVTKKKKIIIFPFVCKYRERSLAGEEPSFIARLFLCSHFVHVSFLDRDPSDSFRTHEAHRQDFSLVDFRNDAQLRA